MAASWVQFAAQGRNDVPVQNPRSSKVPFLPQASLSSYKFLFNAALIFDFQRLGGTI